MIAIVCICSNSNSKQPFSSGIIGCPLRRLRSSHLRLRCCRSVGWRAKALVSKWRPRSVKISSTSPSLSMPVTNSSRPLYISSTSSENHDVYEQSSLRAFAPGLKYWTLLSSFKSSFVIGILRIAVMGSVIVTWDDSQCSPGKPITQVRITLNPGASGRCDAVSTEVRMTRVSRLMDLSPLDVGATLG